MAEKSNSDAGTGNSKSIRKLYLQIYLLRTNPPLSLQFFQIIIFALYPGSGKESPGTYGSIVRLSPGRIDDDAPWWKRRKERIFRKKTLFMRIPILQWLPKYSTEDFVADLVAGLTVGITVIPQALAYATVAGLPPEVFPLVCQFKSLSVLLFIF